MPTRHHSHRRLSGTELARIHAVSPFFFSLLPEHSKDRKKRTRGRPSLSSPQSWRGVFGSQGGPSGPRVAPATPRRSRYPRRRRLILRLGRTFVETLFHRPAPKVYFFRQGHAQQADTRRTGVAEQASTLHHARSLRACVCACVRRLTPNSVCRKARGLPKQCLLLSSLSLSHSRYAQ